jgi:cation diffusion facilitator CzcD-associated flavoprotein CzcO
METFKGQVIHTAQWPDNYGPEEWKGTRVAVIGAGASSVQTTPSIVFRLLQADYGQLIALISHDLKVI